MKRDASIAPDDCRTMARHCLSMNLRKTERVITRHYDSSLAAAGITAVQLPILAAIVALEDPSFRTLSEDLELDRTTLSRNLALLQQRGLLSIGTSSGPKPGRITLTPKGRRTLHHGHQLWLDAHRALESALPESSIDQGLRFLRRLRRVVKK